ncbi:MAG: electron transfer flavoprotein subunit beta/FixA family protein, partial [Clostridia bacterium]|nr:electron transfer flavoprotein subunit beta/FixA family protein [Clostridia bacterium]
MKIVVCIRQGLDGEINPFDACAYEAALQIPNSEITLLSMGPEKTKDFLHQLTRRGAKNAVLLSDSAFAGADTLATAYALSLAIKKISPDLIICGRQTLVGDTAQVGPMLSVMCDCSLITNVMEIVGVDTSVKCITRAIGEESADLPALITVERINNLRLPSIRSKMGEISVWSADDIGADKSRCGLAGSPTRVLKTYENSQGKRKCKFITMDELDNVVKSALNNSATKQSEVSDATERLENVVIVGESPREFAQMVSDNITVIEK